MHEILERMQNIIAEQFGVDADSISESTSFEEDLGADSVDLVELVMAMEEEFQIGDATNCASKYAREIAPTGA